MAGEIPDPREAQIAPLKSENVKLRERLAQSEQTIAKLTDFRGHALARLAPPARGDHPGPRRRRRGKQGEPSARTANQRHRDIQLMRQDS
ncbi:hypothetical protein AB0D38_21005 [Streptomyces sp. NPDC048279]|uniref:hypothetical protein n=1 Tax=Streptomyces sp. NPDC048279 TaxID=3154714 RepID=UPI00342442A4